MSNIIPIVGGDIESGTSARTKINVLIDLYNKIAVSNPYYVLDRIDPSYIKKNTPTGQVLSDNGTWVNKDTENLASVLNNGNKTGGFDITSDNGNSYVSIIDSGIILSSSTTTVNSDTTVNGFFKAISSDGNSSIVSEDGDTYSQWSNGIIYSYQSNDANESSLNFYNGSVGFTAFIKAKEFSNDIFHSVKNVFNSPINEFTNGGAYFISGIGIDTTATAGTDVLNIGATNANVINYGNASTIHNFLGTAIYELQVNGYVEDKLITLNHGGSVASGIGVGFEIEEDGVITGHFKTNANRDAFVFKAPNSFESEFSLSALTANRTHTLPNGSGTLALESFVDSKVTDSITDGITTVAPSQNAVFDALAYKENFSNKTSTIIGNETDVDKYTNTKSVADYVNLFVGSGSTTDLGVVISQNNIPPGSPVIGDAYLVGTVPTGTWVGKNNKIATWNGAIWVYTNPSINSTVFITETLTTLRYNGTSWVAFQGTAILQNGNSLGVAMSIGTNDNFDLNFKRNNVVQWSINSLGWLTRTTSGKTTSLNDGFATFSDSSTAGLPGIQFTQTVTNNRISILGRWGQTGGGNFTGTAIGSGDYLQISNGGSSSNTYPIMIRGSIIHNFIGHTGTNIATRLDNVGLRIGTMADIHTANTNLFDLKGKFHHDVNHNVVVGSAALATTATDGFFYIPTCAGTPTGVPTTKTGRIPMVYDSTNNKFYMYNSGWKSVTLT